MYASLHILYCVWPRLGHVHRVTTHPTHSLGASAVRSPLLMDCCCLPNPDGLLLQETSDEDEVSGPVRTLADPAKTPSKGATI